jgi:hypothetical protein
VASKSISQSISTVFRWQSTSRRAMSMTVRVLSRCCANSPAVASREQPWAISAIGLAAGQGRPGTWHHHHAQCRRPRRNLHPGRYSLGH